MKLVAMAILATTCGLLTACGGDTQQNLESVKSCLEEANVDVSDDDDDLTLVGEDAAEGALITDEGIEVIFEENAEAADRGRNGYAAIVATTGDAPDEDTQQFGSAYAYFPKSDTTNEAKSVKGCLE